ncbi:MAG: L,D-transpeptidase [Candidatus Sericytochromatia bacterium]|nr:L,D-transpeptidase [Candidatus Sericytochromatia bacterium]
MTLSPPYIRCLTGLAVGAGLLAAPAGHAMTRRAAAPPSGAPYMLPGTVEGAVTLHRVQPGDDLNELGVRYKLNPVRIVRPSGVLLADGMEVGETIRIDQRRVRPSFPADADGLVLNLPEAHVYLLAHGKLLRDYAVGVSTAERKAPLGPTRVRSMSRNPVWFVPRSIQKEMAEQGRVVKTRVPPGPDNPLGSRWIGFADNTFGFHGTTMPWSIKRYASHGCVRFLRDDIEDLYERVRVGMPVNVIYQPVTMAVDDKAVWVSIYPDYYSTGYDYRAAIAALARRAGVTRRIHPVSLERALRDRDGILVDIGNPPPSPSPSPTARPARSPHPLVTPIAVPAASPSPVATPTPTPAPSASPTATPTPTPPSPTPGLRRPPGWPAYPQGG